MKVLIDPGHGGADRGGHALPGLDEANLNLAISLAVAERLRAAGVEVLLTREKDEYRTLKQRTDMAVARKVDCLVSVHCNSLGGKGTASGIETLVQQASQASKDLGQRVQKAVVAATGLPDRGVKTRDLDDGKFHAVGAGTDPDVDADYYHVLREPAKAGIPAIIVECGFMDNAHDAAVLRDKTVQRRIGEAIADAVVEWGRARGLLPQPAQPDWRVQVLQEARQVGLLTVDHPVGSSVEIEELVAVALRLYYRIAALEQRVANLEAKR